MDVIPNWERCNDMVGSWILNSMSPEICLSILYAETAVQIWADLKESLTQSNALKICQLKQSIVSLKLEEKLVAIYFNSLKSIWDKLGSTVCITLYICRNAKND